MSVNTFIRSEDKKFLTILRNSKPQTVEKYKIHHGILKLFFQTYWSMQEEVVEFYFLR